MSKAKTLPGGEPLGGALAEGAGGEPLLATAPVPAPSRRALSRKRDQRLRRIVRQARRLAPHLDSPVFTPILQSFGRISLLLQDSYEKLRDGDLVGENSELRPSIDTIRRLTETQAKLAEKLGLTPLTLRVLGREKPVDLVAIYAAEDDYNNGD